jgi:hypothetical protein
VFGASVSKISEILGDVTGFLAFTVLALLLWRFLKNDTKR